MFTDPQSITINAVAIPLPRTTSGEGKGVYTSADGNVRETVSHQENKSRNRRMFRVDHQKSAPDPLFPAQNTPYNAAVYIVMDVPKVGYTVAEQKQLVDGFLAQLQATSGALITQFLGGQS
jgi:hypothetical protein